MIAIPTTCAEAKCVGFMRKGHALPRVRIARTFVSRFVGLLNRSHLAADEALMLIPGGSIHTMWMRFPIDVIFLSEQLRVLRVVSNVRPWRLVFAPPGTSLVLELRAGAAQMFELKSGDALRLCR